MPQLYFAGEAVGPGTIVSSEFSVDDDGRTLEHAVSSWGQEWLMHGREPESYFTRTRRPKFLEPGSSRVIVPFTVRHPETEAGLPDDAEWVDVSGSIYEYWNALRDYWLPQHDLTIIEHDVQARPEIFEEFEACPEPWCVFPYSNHTNADAEAWRNMLGCTRFRKELIAAVPDALTNCQPRWRDWHYTCDGIGFNLRAAGFSHHWHGPAVRHHRGIGGD